MMRRPHHVFVILSLIVGRGSSFAISSTSSHASIRPYVQSKMDMSDESKSLNMGDPASVPTAANTANTAKGSAQGGPPQPKGGPPEVKWTGKILESAFEIVFKLLYLGDDSGIQDSSKNLRVLWTRALLNSLGKINDNIAGDLLPSKTRFVVGKLLANLFWKRTPVVKQLDWIVSRTQFIDSQLEEFIKETTNCASNRQVILIGSGYDTRSLRYAQSNIDFYEVDIPEVISKKSVVTKQYLDKSASSASVRFVPLDLNEVLTRNKSIVQELEIEGFQSDLPTIVICEAVLFYLIPGAVQKLISDLFSLNANRYCITDNLTKVGVTPGPPVPTPRQKCEAWVKQSGKELVAHDSIWGGAIHFVGIK